MFLLSSWTCNGDKYAWCLAQKSLNQSCLRRHAGVDKGKAQARISPMCELLYTGFSTAWSQRISAGANNVSARDVAEG